VDVRELASLLRRRWLIVVPMLILTIAATAAGWAKVQTQYESQVQLTMLNAPKITHQPGNFGNPYLAFDSTLAIDVDLLTRNLISDASQQKLEAQGVTQAYTATIASNALGPFMQLTVTGTGQADVSRSITTLVSFAEHRWEQLQ
jgi:uncharacterized protein involved in exopolysaccharide biosynthesis